MEERSSLCELFSLFIPPLTGLIELGEFTGILGQAFEERGWFDELDDVGSWNSWKRKRTSPC